MKYIISVLLLLSTFHVSAQEWNTYQYSNKYSISIPSTLELRKDNDIYTQILNDIQKGSIGYNIKSSNKSKIVFQQTGLSTNKPEYKSMYCRLIIDYFTCKEETYYPYSTDRYDFDISYYQQILNFAQKEMQGFGAQILDVISADTCIINNYLATEVIYKRTGYNGKPPVIVGTYIIFNYTECIRLTFSFREAEQDIWLNDLIKVRDSFLWMNSNHKIVEDLRTSKDEAIKEGLELGILTVWKVILEIIFGCCFLGLIIKSPKKRDTKSVKSISTVDNIKEHQSDTITHTLQTETGGIRKVIHYKNMRSRIWKTVKKILLTTVIIAGSCTICTLMGVYDYYINCFFYFPFYFIVATYYIYLIWIKKKVFSEDIVFYPLLKRIGIYSYISDSYTLRKRLLVSIIPLSLVTLLTSLLVVAISSLAPENDEVSVGSLLLGLPVIAWIVFFVFVYGKKWIDASNKM